MGRQRKPLPRGVRRVMRLATETTGDLIAALADDGRLDVGEAAQIVVRLLALLVQPDDSDATPRPIAAWCAESAALHDLARAIRAGDRDRAHAALDRALGWHPPEPS